MKLSAVEETGYLKSQFYKKSASQKSQTQSTNSTNDLDIAETKGNNSGDLNESFKFRFNILDDNLGDGMKNSNQDINNLNFSAVGKETALNIRDFRMEKSDNTFRFNFDMTDET